MSSGSIEVALVGHAANFDHMGKLLAQTRPDFTTAKLARHRPALTKFFEWSPSYAAGPVLRAIGVNGATVDGRLFICPFLPENLNSSQRISAASKKVREACEMAKGMGARIVGLGGFTSILGGDQGETLARETGIPMTSGNALTAALALAQLQQLINTLHWNLEDRTVAIIGASGDIGLACSRSLAGQCGRLLLIARRMAPLVELRSVLPSPARIEVSCDPKSALQADVILTVASAGTAVLHPNELLPGTIICDVGYPKNLAVSSDRRAEVLSFSAGLASLPFPLDIARYTELPTRHLIHGCFAEALVLGLSREYERGSSGQGCITTQRMDWILALAKEYGVVPAPLYSGSHPITEADLQAFVSLAERDAGARV